VALWSRNLINNRSPSMMQALSFPAIGADYERARTVGMDLSVEF